VNKSLTPQRALEKRTIRLTRRKATHTRAYVSTMTLLFALPQLSWLFDIVRKIDALDEGSSRSAFRPGAVRERPGLPFHTCSGAWLWVTGLSHLPRIFGLKSAKKHAIRTDG